MWSTQWSKLTAPKRQHNWLWSPRAWEVTYFKRFTRAIKALPNTEVLCGGQGSPVMWKSLSSGQHCNIHRSSQTGEPLITMLLPNLSWEKFTTNLFEQNDNHDITVINYISRWLELLEWSKSNFRNSHPKTKKHLYMFWNTRRVKMTDNRPHFGELWYRIPGILASWGERQAGKYNLCSISR